MRRLVSVIFALSLSGAVVVAQQRRYVVVADAETHAPVSYASLYTRDGGVFRSVVTNAQGGATIPFTFQRLTVSHLNYQQRVVRQLADTLLLTPKYRSTGEVVVTNKEPEWIRPKLKQVVKQKEHSYFSTADTMSISYHTRSIGSNNLYDYRLTGLLCMLSSSHGDYSLFPGESIIEAVDSTRLTDTSNLRRMLYEDFVAEFDNGFIRSHKFYENPEYVGSNANEIELRFRSKSHQDDRGWLVVDTARCLVLKAYRFTGTKTNRQERVSAFMYACARLFGYRIDTWTRDYRVTYAERADGTCYPSEVSYKLYYAGSDGDTDQHQQEFDERTGGGFPNMEATLHISPAPMLLSEGQWHTLCPSWYIKYNTDAERQREVELSNLPAEFHLFTEE